VFVLSRIWIARADRHETLVDVDHGKFKGEARPRRSQRYIAAHPKPLATRPELIIQAARRNQDLVKAIKKLIDAWALFTVDPEGFERMGTAAGAARKLIMPRWNQSRLKL
jgi:hypothetical protein